MSGIDFQNGFVCGMATKGLVRSGELYKPLIWNDSGEYGYFYIDFRRDMQAFSTGMYNESIIMHDSAQIKASGVEYVSMGVYKVYADIADLPHGLTVMNKKTSRLRFSSGELLPVFSVHMFIAGQSQYIDGGYVFSAIKMQDIIISSGTGQERDFRFWVANILSSLSEVMLFPETITCSESYGITLT